MVSSTSLIPSCFDRPLQKRQIPSDTLDTAIKALIPVPKHPSVAQSCVANMLTGWAFTFIALSIENEDFFLSRAKVMLVALALFCWSRAECLGWDEPRINEARFQARNKRRELEDVFERCKKDEPLSTEACSFLLPTDSKNVLGGLYSPLRSMTFYQILGGAAIAAKRQNRPLARFIEKRLSFFETTLQEIFRRAIRLSKTASLHRGKNFNSLLQNSAFQEQLEQIPFLFEAYIAMIPEGTFSEEEMLVMKAYFFASQHIRQSHLDAKTTTICCQDGIIRFSNDALAEISSAYSPTREGKFEIDLRAFTQEEFWAFLDFEQGVTQTVPHEKVGSIATIAYRLRAKRMLPHLERMVWEMFDKLLLDELPIACRAYFSSESVREKDLFVNYCATEKGYRRLKAAFVGVVPTHVRKAVEEKRVLSGGIFMISLPSPKVANEISYRLPCESVPALFNRTLRRKDLEDLLGILQKLSSQQVLPLAAARQVQEMLERSGEGGLLSAEACALFLRMEPETLIDVRSAFRKLAFNQIVEGGRIAARNEECSFVDFLIKKLDFFDPDLKKTLMSAIRLHDSLVGHGRRSLASVLMDPALRKQLERIPFLFEACEALIPEGSLAEEESAALKRYLVEIDVKRQPNIKQGLVTIYCEDGPVYLSKLKGVEGIIGLHPTMKRLNPEIRLEGVTQDEVWDFLNFIRGSTRTVPSQQFVMMANIASKLEARRALQVIYEQFIGEFYAQKLAKRCDFSQLQDGLFAELIPVHELDKDISRLYKQVSFGSDYGLNFPEFNFMWMTLNRLGLKPVADRLALHIFRKLSGLEAYSKKGLAHALSKEEDRKGRFSSYYSLAEFANVIDDRALLAVSAKKYYESGVIFLSESWKWICDFPGKHALEKEMFVGYCSTENGRARLMEEFAGVLPKDLEDALREGGKKKNKELNLALE